MDSLYQARVKKSETDLLIDQLKETLHYLTVQNKVAAFPKTGQHAHVCQHSKLACFSWYTFYHADCYEMLALKASRFSPQGVHHLCLSDVIQHAIPVLTEQLLLADQHAQS